MKKKNIGKLSKLTTAVLLLGTLASPFTNLNVKAAATDPAPVKLRIMETTDLHSNVMDYDYYKDAPTMDYGLDRKSDRSHVVL